MLKKLFLGLLVSGILFQDASAVVWRKLLPAVVQKNIEAKEAARREYADKLVSEYEARELEAEALRQKIAQGQALIDEINAVETKLSEGFKSGMSVMTWVDLEKRKYSAWEQVQKMTAGRPENILPDTRSAFAKKWAEYSTFEFKKMALLKAKQFKNTVTNPKIIVVSSAVTTAAVVATGFYIRKMFDISFDNLKI